MSKGENPDLQPRGQVGAIPDKAPVTVATVAPYGITKLLTTTGEDTSLVSSCSGSPPE
jgi:hypothetical protein